jgi:antitoxin VapB
MALKTEHAGVGEQPAETVKTVRDPIVDAILQRIRRQPPRDPAQIEKALRDIGERCAKLPVLDDRTPDEILGYDEHGLPH